MEMGKSGHHLIPGRSLFPQRSTHTHQWKEALRWRRASQMEMGKSGHHLIPGCSPFHQRSTHTSREGSIEVKESKSNGDGEVWASSHSR
eukprot:9789839-Ditylum_brightwellii.AAC.1